MIQNPFPLVPLGEVLNKSDEVIKLDASGRYKQITIKLWGKGVVQRDEVLGSEIADTKRFVARCDQFILSRIDARNGAFGLVPDFLDGAVVSQDFPVFFLNQRKMIPRFLNWMSKTQSFIDLCKAASEGTTNRVRLKEGKFLTMQIPLPPVAEQERIVGRIETLVAKIAEARGLQAAVEKDNQHLLLSAYYELIAEARYEEMKKVAPFVRRPIAVNFLEAYHELGVRSFGKGTFHKPALRGVEVNTKKLFRIEPNDLVFNNVFAWEGAIAVAKSEDTGRVGSHRFITCIPKEGVATSQFLRFHFLTREGLEKIGNASPGGAGRNRTLGLDGLAKIPVPIPDFKKQLWFDGLQAKVMAIKQLQAETEAELKAMLPSVLDKAFKGEL